MDHNLFIHSSIWSCFHLLAMYPHQCTGTCSSPCFKSFWVYIPMKFLGHVEILCLTSEEPWQCLPQWPLSFGIPYNSIWGFPFLCLLANIYFPLKRFFNLIIKHYNCPIGVKWYPKESIFKSSLPWPLQPHSLCSSLAALTGSPPLYVQPLHRQFPLPLCLATAHSSFASNPEYHFLKEALQSPDPVKCPNWQSHGLSSSPS